MQILMVIYFTASWGNGFSGGDASGISSQIVSKDACNKAIEYFNKKPGLGTRVECITIKD